MTGKAGPIESGILTPEEMLRYAMSLPVATTICGMNKIETLRDNLRVAQQFEPMGADEMQRVRERCAPTAADGRFELYKVSLAFDNPQARVAHGFPIDPVQMEVKEELQHAMGTDHMK